MKNCKTKRVQQIAAAYCVHKAYVTRYTVLSVMMMMMMSSPATPIDPTNNNGGRDLYKYKTWSPSARYNMSCTWCQAGKYNAQFTIVLLL